MASTQPQSANAPADLRTFRQLGQSDIPLELVPTLLSMQEQFGVQLPADITYETASVAEPALADLAFRSNYDEGYCGHFSIPGSAGAAARFEQIMAQPDPLAFIRQYLSFSPTKAEMPDSRTSRQRPQSWLRRWLGRQSQNPGLPKTEPTSPEVSPEQQEWVVFAPGLNTLHAIQPGWEGETTTPQRLQDQYIPILQTPMAQLHLGTDMDQGEAVLPVSPGLRQALEDNRAALEAAGLMPQLDQDAARFDPRQRDRVEALLSQQGLARPLFQQHAIQLFKLNETAQRPMVWMVYSRSTGELSSALRRYIADFVAEATARDPQQTATTAQAQVESLLRQLLTVISIGNSDRNWPDGPAYVHYSAKSDRPEGGTDPLTQDFGVHADAPKGAGQDAVFVHVDGIFSGFDAHNFGASGAAGLKLVLDLNGCTTYRQLWEKGRAGSLRLPSSEQVAAKVVLTDGAKWLWNPQAAWAGVNLPSQEAAARLLAGL